MSVLNRRTAPTVALSNVQGHIRPDLSEGPALDPWVAELQRGSVDAAWDLFLDRYRRLIFAAIRHYARTLFIMFAAACSDTAGPTDSPCLTCVTDEGLVISDPIQTTAVGVAGTASLPSAAGAGDSVVYISLAPGSEVDGSIATVRLLSSLSSVTTTIADGGFDPVPLTASDGDSVEVFVRDVSGTVLLHTVSPVVGARRPAVVRTNPPPRKRDVPLNSVIVTVLSEPAAAGSLTPGSVRLLRGSVAVPGSVRLLAGTATGVAFVPSSPLAPNVTYRLQVTSAIRDLDGESLATTFESDFTTGTTTTGPVASVTLHPDSADVAVGSQFQLGVTARDSAGYEIVGHAILWASNAPAVLSVSATGLATALAEGYTDVTADIDGVQGYLVVNVSAALTPVADVEVSPDSATVLVGDSVQLTIDARDSLGLPIDRRLVVWTSTNPAVAGVVPATSQTAMVRGLASGTALIVARIDGKSDTSIIRVGTIGPIVDLVLSPPRATLVAQDTVRLTAFGRDAQGFMQRLNAAEVAWSSSNSAVATVTSAGLVTGRAPDSTTISGTWSGRRGSASIAVVHLSFASISVGGGHTCGIVPTGAAYCWGYGWEGQAGTGSLGWFVWPTAVAGDHRFVELDASEYDTCALDDGGVAYCWGQHPQGADRCMNGACDLVPAAIAGDLRFASFKTGGSRLCGLTRAHTTYCWEFYTDAVIRGPTLIDDSLAFSSITVGSNHACGVTSTGTAYCWGLNYSGQLGTGDSTDSEAPRRVTDTLRFALLSAAETHTCGLTTSGATYCWGTPSAYGRGGSPVPAPVMNGVTFTTLSGAAGATCGLRADGSIQCWDDWGPRASRLPWTVPGNLVFTRLSAARHSCAITISDVAYCWGSNNAGQLGIGTIGESYANPTKVGGQP